MNTIDDLWQHIYTANSLTIDVKTSALKQVKRRLSSHKHRKVQEMGEDCGRLLSTEIEENIEGMPPIKKGYTRIRFWLEEGGAGEAVPATIVHVERSDDEWGEAL